MDKGKEMGSGAHVEGLAFGSNFVGGMQIGC